LRGGRGLSVTGSIDARGAGGSTFNAGTVKIFHRFGSWTGISSGRTFTQELNPCTPPLGGDWAPRANCSFSGVTGVDAGNLNLPTDTSFTFTLGIGAATSTFARNVGRSINLGIGSIVIQEGSSIVETDLWILDADGDGYAASTEAVNPATNQVAQGASPGASHRRRSTVLSYTDVNDANPNVF
jgi:hypothetical protein